MKTYYYGNPGAETVLIQMVDDHDLSVIEQEAAHIQDLTENRDFLLAAIKADSWNGDLSPWPAPPVFGDEPFGNGAEETLAYLTEELIPKLPDPAGRAARTYYIGGYSLAGLFALWAVYQTDLFSGAAAASPSVWFPGFREYACTNVLKTNAVYLSLGDKEETTRHPVMSQVGNAIREIRRYLENAGVSCTLEWNRGNHFRDPDLRTAKGFAWLINNNKRGQKS